MFTVTDVQEFLDLVQELDVEVWIDGGWAVDAHLGRQTRNHEDLDIVLRTRDEPLLRTALEERGFGDVDTPDRRACNFVLAHPDGRRIDFHLVTFDDSGNGLYDVTGPPFPAVAFTGRGTIDGRSVRCIEPRTLVEFHTGYQHDEDDLADVTALCDHFGFDLPPQYRSRHEG